VIISVRQEYKSIEGRKDYKTGTKTTYRGQDVPIDIGEARKNFDKDGKPKCFNCNVYVNI